MINYLKIMIYNYKFFFKFIFKCYVSLFSPKVITVETDICVFSSTTYQVFSINSVLHLTPTSIPALSLTCDIGFMRLTRGFFVNISAFTRLFHTICSPFCHVITLPYVGIKDSYLSPLCGTVSTREFAAITAAGMPYNNQSDRLRYETGLHINREEIRPRFVFKLLLRAKSRIDKQLCLKIKTKMSFVRAFTDEMYFIALSVLCIFGEG